MSLPTTVSDSFRRLNPGLYPQPVSAQASAAGPIRQKSGPKLNKTETAALEYLRSIYKSATILSQSVTLLLANGVRYTPDFIICLQDHPCEGWAWLAYEVKGTRRGKAFAEDDSKVKIKVAASMYPQIEFNIIWKNGDGWSFQKVHP